MRRKEAYCDDLSDFARNGSLDAYELTDEELAQLLELWRWSVWRRVNQPTSVDYNVLQQARQMQRRLAHEHNLEVEYNTALLLKQEIEPLMHARALLSASDALTYFAHPRRFLSLFRALWQIMRYQQIAPMRSEQDGTPEGYPLPLLARFRARIPNMIKRPYWRQLHPHTFDERKRHDEWW
jgi:hypothetical protein